MQTLYQRCSRIYLTGFMGSGKSTIGPILANTIGYNFVDLDKKIELQEGITVQQIFKTRGDERFRELELQALEEIAATAGLVISLGGGTVTHAPSFDLIKRTGIVVYLSISREEVLRRLQRRSDRPLLLDDEGRRLSEGDLRERVRQLLETREPLYREADLIVPTDEKRLGRTVDAVVRILSPHLRPPHGSTPGATTP